jgi:hypothetical protein
MLKNPKKILGNRFSSTEEGSAHVFQLKLKDFVARGSENILQMLI